MRSTILPAIVFSIVAASASPAQASGRAILGNIKFNFWSDSSDTSISHHQERPGRRTAQLEDCWYVNEWQKTRHGKTVKNRIRKCR